MINELELVEQIKYHQQQYWNNDPKISDVEYDELILKLKETNPNHELLSKIEYNPNSDSTKIRHVDLMLSLEKVFDYNSILQWALKTCRHKQELLSITPKYDGISARYYINTNILATRGDGEFGEDISDKIPFITFVYNNKNKEYYNGEILTTKDKFEKIKTIYKRKDGKDYSNPRNFTGGFLNSKDNSLTGFTLTFIEHSYDQEIISLENFTESAWNDILFKITNNYDNYPMDGIVISIVDEDYSKSLGFTSHHPRSKVAFKFETEFAYSTIKEVEFSCGKRKITPVAIIEPTVINNVTIKRVTLHNAKMLLDNNINIGDIVKVVRSGDVIPYISEIKPGENRKKIIINICPSCGGRISYKEPDLFCNNPQCEGSNAKLLFQSIQTLGIDNIGLTTIEKFIEVLEINSIIDILNISEDELSLVPGFGEIMITKIYNNIQKIKDSPIDDYKLLACLNIKGIGNSLSKVILEKYTLDELLNSLEEIDFTLLNGFSETRADDLYNGIIENYEILNTLITMFNIINTKDVIKSKLDSKKICFTGKFDYNKSYYYQKAIEKGFTIVDDVTKDIDYVITSGAASSKLSKAKKFNITILNINQFLDLIK